ncbi:MAG: hypothetical protein QOI23_56 [Chloroflexota bacterium]|jgi:hypothetical protein|nr:hypothetical protein [Chloroflexota bacterium]
MRRPAEIWTVSRATGRRELPFDVRQRMLRRSRRRSTIHRMTSDGLWIALLTGGGILVLAEVIVAASRA